MNSMLRIILTIAICLGSLALTGQTIQLDKKALSVLASEEKINVIFAFNNIVYDRGDLSEPEFINDVTEKIITQGSSTMAKEWIADFEKAKSKHWPEAFITILNQDLRKYKNAPAFNLDNKTTRYLMVVHTYWMDFGYDIGIVKRPAQANMMIYFYDTSNPIDAISSSRIHHAEGLVNESRYRNDEYPKPSLASMKHMYERVATELAKSLKKVVR